MTTWHQKVTLQGQPPRSEAILVLFQVLELLDGLVTRPEFVAGADAHERLVRARDDLVDLCSDLETRDTDRAREQLYVAIVTHVAWGGRRLVPTSRDHEVAEKILDALGWKHP